MKKFLVVAGLAAAMLTAIILPSSASAYTYTQTTYRDNYIQESTGYASGNWKRRTFNFVSFVANTYGFLDTDFTPCCAPARYDFYGGSASVGVDSSRDDAIVWCGRQSSPTNYVWGTCKTNFAN